MTRRVVRAARRRAVVFVVALAMLSAIAETAMAAAQNPSAEKPPAQAPAGPPNAARDTLNAALKAYEAKDFAAAERHFVQVTKLAPNVAEGWLGLAETRLRLDRTDDALAAARQAQKLAPDSAPAHFLVARCLAEKGSLPEALVASDRARQLDPTNVESALRKDEAGQALENAWKNGNHDVRLAEQLAFSRFDRDDAAGAAAVAEEGLKADPERANLKLVLGFALAKNPARRSDAIRWLREALAAGVTEPGQVHLALGGLLLDDGKPAEAIPHLDEATRLMPSASGPQYKLAQARRAAGDEAGAEQALARYTELEERERTADRDGKELGIALNEAQTLANADKLAESLERLDALAAAHPDDARVLALRAKVLYSMGRRREAELAIDAAVARMPDRAEYQYLAGLFHMYAGRAAQAQASLERALAIDDGLATAHALLAGALVKQSKLTEALSHFEEAIELGADSAEVRLGYAEALKSLGRAKEADAQMDAYRRLTSGSP